MVSIGSGCAMVGISLYWRGRWTASRWSPDTGLGAFCLPRLGRSARVLHDTLNWTGDIHMDYEPIKQRYVHMFRLADLTHFSFFDSDEWSPIEAREAEHLFDELGDVNLDDYDASIDQLCGCQDVAPEQIRREYHLEDDPSATFH